jgi:hypothetical protein
MSEQKIHNYEIHLRCDDRAEFIEKLTGLLTPFPEVHAAAVAAERERCRLLVRSLPDPNKLEILARWFDMEQQKNPDRWVKDSVQQDLRRWADNARRARDAYFAAVRNAYEVKP